MSSMHFLQVKEKRVCNYESKDIMAINRTKNAPEITQTIPGVSVTVGDESVLLFDNAWIE